MMGNVKKCYIIIFFYVLYIRRSLTSERLFFFDADLPACARGLKLRRSMLYHHTRWGQTTICPHSSKNSQS